MLKGFTLIKYTGDDAGEVLCTLLSEGESPDEVHEVESRAPIGFRPNEESDEDDESV